LNGACSYVNILTGLNEFYFGLNEVCEGRDFIASDVTAELKVFKREEIESHAMTPTEIEVIALHYKGHENDEIAELLYMAVNTVLKHKRNIKNKMKTSNTQTAAYNAVQIGLIDPYEKNYFPNSIMIAKKAKRGRLRQQNKVW
jgi:DNA-binding NarL/FixJ family response regulator